MTLLLSVGGYRSGSTYCYNLLGELVERANLGRRVGYLEPTWAAPLGHMWSIFDALGTPVGKTHDAPGVTPGAEAWEPLVESGAVRGVCTVRDWRDVLHSFSRKFGESPEAVLASRRWAINQRNYEWWLAAGSVPVRYEDLLARPAETLAAAAAALGIPVDGADLHAAVSAAAVLAASDVTSALPPGGVHRRTLLHFDHIGTPAGGGWRTWPDDVLERVRPALEPLLTAFGYAW